MNIVKLYIDVRLLVFEFPYQFLLLYLLCIYFNIYIYYSLRHSAGPPAFGLQAHSNGCVKLVGVKGWLDDGDDGDGGDDDGDDDDD